MKILRIQYVLIVIIIILAAGCQPVNQPAVVNPTPTNDIPPTVETAAPSVSPSITAEPSEIACKELVSETLPADAYSGRILYYDRHQQESWMKDLRSGDQFQFENTYATYISTSPSLEQVAYTPEIDNKMSTLVIYDAATASEKTFSLDSQRLSKHPHISGWIGSDKVAFRMPEAPPQKLYLIQVTTGNRQILSPNYPDIFSMDPWQWAGWGRTIYSPDLRYVVYPTTHTIEMPQYVLWDRNEKKEVSSIETWYMGELPQWAPDGQKYAVVVDKDLVVAGLDGSKTRVTDLAKDYPDHDLKIRLWSWSPDSTKIAIWLDFYPKGYFSLLHEEREGIYPEERLMVVDVVTKETHDLCIQGDSVWLQLSGIGPKFSPTPIWSPDGKELLVEERLNMEESRLLIVDLEKSEGFSIGKDTYPIGWIR